MFSVSGLGACISCFSHWCDKIFHKSNFREEDFIWVTEGATCHVGGGGMAARVGGGWSSGHITLAIRKQRGECCCSPGLHTWLAHLAFSPGFLLFSFLISPGLKSKEWCHPHSGWLFPPSVHPLGKRPHVLTDTLLECVFYMTTNPDKVTKIKHHSIFWSFGLPFSNDSLPYLPHLLLWCDAICSATRCGTGLGSPPCL